MQTQLLTVSCKARQIAYGKLISDSDDNALIFAQRSCHDVAATTRFDRDLIIVDIDEVVRMSIAYRIIGYLVLDRSDYSITLVLNEPPKFYSRLDIAYTRFRQAGILGWESHCEDVPHYRTYRICFEKKMFDRALNALDSRRSLRVFHLALPVQRKDPVGNRPTTSVEDFETRLRKLHCEEKLIPFTLVFQALALVWSGHLHPESGCDMIREIQSLFEHANPDPMALADLVRRRLSQAAPFSVLNDSQQDCNSSTVLESLTSSCWTETDFRENRPDGNNHANVRAPVFKAWVTPTRILLRGPDLEAKNRVLRMFPKKTDHFLRVTFCDEDGEDLSYDDRVSNDNVFARYRRVLLRGITVAGRRFQFLAFSHSSLRSHSAWFCSSFVDQSLALQDCQSILKTLGDFRNIRVPAKCAARIGQAFSETPIALSLSQRGISLQYIADVKNSTGTRVFSDGVGTISRSALREVWDCLPQRLGQPTCIQIRIAGIKGMLSLDSQLRKKTICIRRESMMKFKSNDLDVLGICDAGSRPLRFTLNRQIIKILEDMGISDTWFLTLQDKAIKNLLSAASCARHTSTFLKQQGVGTSLGLPELIEKLGEIGIDYREDDFLRSVVGQTILCELRSLKYKARIPVSRGVTLFGVMDETSFLQDGQIYVTYDAVSVSGPTGIEPAPADGRVLVTRSPALHPGDIQYVEMVTPPFGHPLLQLRNCIVFSSQGSRDLPSKLSGGDLDGDLYNVIWDPDAIPSRHFEPAEYPRIPPEPLTRSVSQEDMANFFIDFMKSDVLGIIANRHQAYADLKSAGTLDPECIRLAEMHSTAVDYSKSGVPVNAQLIPKAPQERPDL